MIDYRLKENRAQFFGDLYRMNLAYQVMPGLVYLYMPELARRLGWDAEQRLWFAFLNGMTQNPITSLRMFERLPECPPAGAGLSRFEEWFNAEWDTLQFDTDRRYQKKETVAAIKAYAVLVDENLGGQKSMLSWRTYDDIWAHVRQNYFSFGRLSTFSYLEYVHLNGLGPDCTDLLFEDKSGSRSHRNGMFFLLGLDNLVWDKRLPNGQDGAYPNFKNMCSWLAGQADEYLTVFKDLNPDIPGASRFTLESNLCTFKNHFFGRRYPGVYADMAWDRIVWADARGQSTHTEVFKDMRAEGLPEWLRAECETVKLSVAEKAKIFPATGSLPRMGCYCPERYAIQ